jgi:DNA-binding transcriptional regulator YhcF (GntR family)
MEKSINQNGKTVKPFNGEPGIFIPSRILDALHGDYYSAAIVSQLFYWAQVSENAWKLQTMRELAKQLRMKYSTFFRHIKKLKQAGLIVIEKRGNCKIIRLNLVNLQTTTCQNDNYEVVNLQTTTCQNDNYEVVNLQTTTCQNDNYDTLQSLETQAIPSSLDYIEINNETNSEINKKSIISSDNNFLSQDINFSKFEKSTRLEGVISELKNTVAPNYVIPKEFEELLLSEMLRAGFPRKSLKSRIDREYLHILMEHYGSWEGVIKAFQNLQKLRAEGRFLEWDWSRILRNADFLANYEPEPEFPVDRIGDLDALRRYFANVHPPAKYVARFVYRWVNHWKFVDMPPERTKRLIQEILHYYYPETHKKKDIEFETETESVAED